MTSICNTQVLPIDSPLARSTFTLKKPLFMEKIEKYKSPTGTFTNARNTNANEQVPEDVVCDIDRDY
jgi:hypothetical protein